MRVTPEMVMRAHKVRIHTLGMAWDVALPAILEAALADVPDINAEQLRALNDHFVPRAALMAAESHAATLEAQLAAVREVVREMRAEGATLSCSGDWADRLEEALKGERPGQ